MACERVQEADAGALWLVEQNEEALRGAGGHDVVMELRDVDLDALAGACTIEEGAAAGRGALVPEHGPPPGMEPAVEAAVRARIRRAPPPPRRVQDRAYICLCFNIQVKACYYFGEILQNIQRASHSNLPYFCLPGIRQANGVQILVARLARE